MSAIASFYLLDTSTLEDLRQNAKITVKKNLFSKKVIDNYRDYLTNNTTEVGSRDGGYIYDALLFYLQEEKNIDLLTNQYNDITKELEIKRGCGHFLFTNKQKESFLNQLDPDLYSLEEMQKFNQEYSYPGDEEAALIILDAMKLLYDNLAKIQSNNQLLLLIIG